MSTDYKAMLESTSNHQPTISNPVEAVVSVPDTEWHIETSEGSKLTYFKGLSLQQVIDSFYESNDKNDHIVSIKNLAH